MIDMITGATLLMSTVSMQMGAGAVNETMVPPSEAKPAEIENYVPAKNENIDFKTNYEKEVREFFKGHPVLAEISGCESSFMQFKKNGELVRGRVNPLDVGLMQINEKYHLEKSKSLGYDIYTVEGNLNYALHMYEEDGAQPWSASKACWGPKLQLASAN